MKGDKDIIEVLNAVLSAELAAINQYFIHHKMLDDWGYPKLSAKKREESLEEMRHAEEVIERILFLDGIPNMMKMMPVRVGEDPIEMHEVDLALEVDAVGRLNEGISLCREKMDNGTRDLLERILVEEEDAIDWLEAQLHLVSQLSKERYLAEHIAE